MSPVSSTAFQRTLYAGVLPPHRDYITEAFVFPGANARDPWEMEGNFRFKCRVISAGKELAQTASQSCDERGFVLVKLEDCMKGLTEPGDSYAVMEIECDANIPIGFYFAHIHRKTGIYYPAPALQFMGDLIYPHAHTEQLENSLFWPGLPQTSNTEFRLAIINPYDVPMSVEATAWHNIAGHATSGVRRVSAHECLWLSLDEWIPASWRADDTPVSICISAQFKLVAWMVMVNRSSGIITSTDHLHAYQLQ